MLLKSGVPPCKTETLSTEIMKYGIEGAKVGNQWTCLPWENEKLGIEVLWRIFKLDEIKLMLEIIALKNLLLLEVV